MPYANVLYDGAALGRAVAAVGPFASEKGKLNYFFQNVVSTITCMA